MISRIIIILTQVFGYPCIRIIGFFRKKPQTSFFCVPDEALLKDGGDLINYSADNTLTFVNYLMRNSSIVNLKLFVVCYDTSRKNEFLSYINKFKSVQIEIVYHKNYNDANGLSFLNKLIDKYRYYAAFYNCRYILSSNVLFDFPYMALNQKHISLNYFTPFKFDIPVKRNTKQIKAVISTSNISSQVVSITSNVPYSRFINLGFSRNDNIIKPRLSKAVLLKFLEISLRVDKIVLYTPTHRYHDFAKLSKNEFVEKDVFGYDGDYQELNQILEQQNAYLLIKVHPVHRRELLSSFNYDRIKILERNYNYTLYDVLAYSDLLITDYTSTYFDFLLRNKPVIFNFYDKEKYQQERGFSYEPIETICAGPIVTNKNDLVEAINQVLVFESLDHQKHRILMNNFFNKYHDSQSSFRIEQFIKSITN